VSNKKWSFDPSIFSSDECRSSEISHITTMPLVVASVVVVLVIHVVCASLPNFVFILTDDQGQYSIGYNNPQIISPHIDELASTGVLLTEFYTYMYCSPTRLPIANFHNS
jgi:hypothetical protein